MSDNSSEFMGTMLSAFLGFCIVAASVFAGWHLVLKYAPANPYQTPQKPYVSVSKTLKHHRAASIEKDFESQIIDFWRFGAV